MLVGEVRCATTGSGSSWKLSGGSSVIVRASTKRLEEAPGAARDQAQRVAHPRGDRARDRESGGERLTQRATSRRQRCQSRIHGAATASDAGASDPTSDARPTRRVRRRRPSAGRSRRDRARAPSVACAAVTHSSILPARHEQTRRACARSRRPSARPDARGTRRGARSATAPSAMSVPARAGGSASRSRVAAAGCRPSSGSRRRERDRREHEGRPTSAGGRAGSSPARERASARRPAPTACGAGCRASSSAKPRNRGAAAIAARVPPAAEDPRQQLPVAARPAVLARRRDVVARRELLDDLDVGDEPGAREDALEEIVAEERVLGDPAGERRLEGVDVVDALAGVRALRRRGPGTRRTPRTRRGRCRRGPRRRAGRASLRVRSAATA